MGDIYHAGEVYAGSVPIDDTQASDETVYSSAETDRRIQALIKHTTQSISLDANGNANLSTLKPNNSVIVCIFSSTSQSNHIITPYLSGSKSNPWKIHVVTTTNTSPGAVSMDLDIYYVSI